MCTEHDDHDLGVGPPDVTVAGMYVLCTYIELGRGTGLADASKHTEARPGLTSGRGRRWGWDEAVTMDGRRVDAGAIMYSEREREKSKTGSSSSSSSSS